MSHTELYMKYVDATQQCRQERAFRRRNEVLLEQVNSASLTLSPCKSPCVDSRVRGMSSPILSLALG